MSRSQSVYPSQDGGDRRGHAKCRGPWSEGAVSAELTGRQQQPEGFRKQAMVEADGTMIETWGQRKEGIGMNYKGQ
jgi:hypothetical protein